MDWVVIGLVAIAALISVVVSLFQPGALSPAGIFWVVVATILLLGVSAVLMERHSKEH